MTYTLIKYDHSYNPIYLKITNRDVWMCMGKFLVCKNGEVYCKQINHMIKSSIVYHYVALKLPFIEFILVDIIILIGLFAISNTPLKILLSVIYLVGYIWFVVGLLVLVCYDDDRNKVYFRYATKDIIDL